MIYSLFLVFIATLSLATPAFPHQQRMLDRINTVRIQAGLTPVAFSEELSTIAHSHSVKQSTAGTVFRAGVSALRTSAAAIELFPQYIGEAEVSVLSSNAVTAFAAMISPEADPKNIKDLYNPVITHVGIDFIRKRPDFYWTVIVAKMNPTIN